jgi:hypothetical protein
MTAQRASTGLTREMQIALICGALLFVAIAGYFTLVSSKRSEAKKLRAETVKVQAQIDRTRSTAYAKALPASSRLPSSGSPRPCRTTSRCRT